MQSVEHFAVFYQISTDSELAPSLSNSWDSCVIRDSLFHMLVQYIIDEVVIDKDADDAVSNIISTCTGAHGTARSQQLIAELWIEKLLSSAMGTFVGSGMEDSVT